MKVENSKSTFSIALRNYKENFIPLFLLSLSFIILAIVVMSLEVVVNFSLFVTVPFVLSPFYFGLLVMNVRIKREKNVSLNRIYLYLLPGLSAPIRMAIKPLRTLLKAFLIFIVATFLLSIVANWVFPIFSPLFADFMNQLNLIILSGTTTYEEINAFIISQYDVLSPFYNGLFLLAGLISVLYFIYAISVNSLVLYGIIGWGPLSINLATLSKRMIQKSKLRLFQFFIKNQWLSILLFVFGYATFGIISLIFIQDFSLLLVISLIGGLVFQGGLLPHYLDVQSQLFEMFRPIFNESLRVELNNFLTFVETDPNLNEEQKTELKKFCLSALKDIDKKEEKKDDPIRP